MFFDLSIIKMTIKCCCGIHTCIWIWRNEKRKKKTRGKAQPKKKKKT